MKGIQKVAFAALVLAPALAAADCRPVVGRFEATIVGAGCTSPLCTAGRVWGGIQGQYSFAMTGVHDPATIGGIPSAIFFAGQSQVALKDGTVVTGTDSGTIDFAQGGFASLISFGAAGEIRLRGQLSATGTSGDYDGTFCTP